MDSLLFSLALFHMVSCELRMSPVSYPSLTTATSTHPSQTFSLFLCNAPQSRDALHHSVFSPPAYLSYLTATGPELRGILKPSSFSLLISRKKSKALKYVLTDSLSAPSDLLKSRSKCLPHTLSFHACQGRNHHKHLHPKEKQKKKEKNTKQTQTKTMCTSQ